MVINCAYLDPDHREARLPTEPERRAVRQARGREGWTCMGSAVALVRTTSGANHG